MSSMGNSQDNIQDNTQGRYNPPHNKLIKAQQESLSTTAYQKQQQNGAGFATKHSDSSMIKGDMMDSANRVSKQQNSNKDNARSHINDGDANFASAHIVHPNFNPNITPMDPDRPLDDIPTPAPRYQNKLQQLFDTQMKTSSYHIKPQDLFALSQQSEHVDAEPSFAQASKWDLIASSALASHLELLQVGGLIQLPASFFEPVIKPKTAITPSMVTTPNSVTTSQTAQSNSDNCRIDSTAPVTKAVSVKGSYDLLSPLSQLSLLDLSDIYQVCQQYPNLSRYGFNVDGLTNTAQSSNHHKRYGLNAKKQSVMSQAMPQASQEAAYHMPEMINDMFAPHWELILYPERFDNGVDSLATDILACSVAVHILKQCQIRKTVNRSITVHQICQHMRSYILSQCRIYPQHTEQYRQIRLFDGHVIVAAYHLGLQVIHASHHSTKTYATHHPQKNKPLNHNLGQPVYLNLSSRSALMCRYPNISSYYINGWS